MNQSDRDYVLSCFQQCHQEIVNYKCPVDIRTTVVVHCVMGINRSASAIIYHLMHEKKLSYGDAMTHLKELRPIIAPDAVYTSVLKTSAPVVPIITPIVSKIKSHTLLKGVALVCSVLLIAGLAAAFGTCWVYYFAPKVSAVNSRLELTCTLINVTTYGSTCQTSKTECTQLGRSSSCETKYYDNPCERATLLWQFVVNGTNHTDTRDRAYDNQKIGQTQTCWWNGELSFDSATKVLMGPRAAIGLLGITVVYLCIGVIVMAILCYYYQPESPEIGPV